MCRGWCNLKRPLNIANTNIENTLTYLSWCKSVTPLNIISTILNIYGHRNVSYFDDGANGHLCN